MTAGDGQRRTEQGDTIDVALLRGFLKRALADDAVADKVDELLFAHVVEGCYHPAVVAEALPNLLNGVIGAARIEDWQAIAEELIAEAREADGEVLGVVRKIVVYVPVGGHRATADIACGSAILGEPRGRELRR